MCNQAQQEKRTPALRIFKVELAVTAGDKTRFSYVIYSFIKVTLSCQKNNAVI